MNNNSAMERRCSVPKVGSKQWQKAIREAIKSGKVRYSLPKQVKEPSAAYVFLMTIGVE